MPRSRRISRYLSHSLFTLFDFIETILSQKRKIYHEKILPFLESCKLGSKHKNQNLCSHQEYLHIIGINRKVKSYSQLSLNLSFSLSSVL